MKIFTHCIIHIPQRTLTSALFYYVVVVETASLLTFNWINLFLLPVVRSYFNFLLLVRPQWPCYLAQRIVLSKWDSCTIDNNGFWKFWSHCVLIRNLNGWYGENYAWSHTNSSSTCFWPGNIHVESFKFFQEKCTFEWWVPIKRLQSLLFKRFSMAFHF